jgi:hypothetical protein
MRTGGPSSSSSNTPSTNGEDDDGGDGEYLFAPVRSETVFAYPGTPAPGQGGFGGESIYLIDFLFFLRRHGGL